MSKCTLQSDWSERCGSIPYSVLGKIYLPRSQHKFTAQLFDVSSVLPYGHLDLDRIRYNHSNPSNDAMFDVCSSLSPRARIHCAVSHSKRVKYPMRRVGVDGKRGTEYFYDDGATCEQKKLMDVKESRTTVRLDHVV
jgi:hypothetical protein